MSKAKPQPTHSKKFLNVGGGRRDTAIPSIYDEWEHILLDIDPSVNPDIVCDARQLTTLPAKEFDAVYCSHNLEHYFRHDALKVLQGFHHILHDDGFALIRVPDIQFVMQFVAKHNLDISDTLYKSFAGPITVRDIIYGFEKEIEESGQDYYAHKTGFSTTSLKSFLHQSGFSHVGIGTDNKNFEIVAVGFKKEPSLEAKNMLQEIK